MKKERKKKKILFSYNICKIIIDLCLTNKKIGIQINFVCENINSNYNKIFLFISFYLYFYIYIYIHLYDRHSMY